MNRYLTHFVTGVVVVMLVLSSTGMAFAAEDSYIVGRLLGTVQPLPQFFQTSTYLMTQNFYPEFRFFRIVNSQSGKKININPLRSNGYFAKSLEPGTWVLERQRKDSPGEDRGKIIEIMTFEVPEGSLINLGTLQVVLDGEPKEKLRPRGGGTDGEYIYTYHYERTDGATDMAWPVDNLKKKKSKVFDKYQDNLVDISEPVTTETDTSKILIQDSSGSGR